MSDVAATVRGFRASFRAEPELVVHAPGRVNLVGDHVDYLHLPVLPMAVPHGIRMALRRRADPRIRVHDADGAFPPVEFEAAADVAPEGSWGDYVRAGVVAIAQSHPTLHGFDAYVTSDLPVAAGMSSSSALVVASALAVLAANALDFDRIALAGTLAQGERYVGTEGGGMDQAASLCAEPGAALRIDFAPLRVRAVRVPAHWRFLSAFSLRQSRKSEEVRAAYNERSRSARSALAALAPGRGGDALLAWIESDRADEALAREPSPRLRHVITEARRVLAATGALERDDAAAFGHIMTASHASLRDDYQVSTAELDEIVDIALDAGALGARLTGAGFGGSAVMLCTPETEAGVRRALLERFYRPRAATPAPVLAVAPSAGATVNRL